MPPVYWSFELRLVQKFLHISATRMPGGVHSHCVLLGADCNAGWWGFFTVACSQEVQGALTGAAELASTSSQEDASEPEAAAAGGSQQGKGMAQSKGRAEASLADAAQHRKRRLKKLMAEQELALNLGSATGTRCSSMKGEACSASCEGLGGCEIAGRAQHQATNIAPCKHA